MNRLTSISIALSKEKNRDKLLEMILIEAKSISNADGGTLYMREGENELRFKIVMTDSLNIHMGGTSPQKVTFPNLKLKNSKGEINNHQIATHVAATGKSINIPDAYTAEGFDFSGTRAFDRTTGYRSKSFLTVPLKNHEDEIIGVLQLLNAMDRKTREIIPFNHDIEDSISALASQAAITITNKNLVKDLKILFESFIKVIAGAIDKKSPYTGGHCQRVPELTMAIAEAVNKVDYGKYKKTSFSNKELYELSIASWLHDAGKVTIPEYVVDKGTKLETIYDRIETIKYKFEVLKRDAEIEYLKSSRSPKDEKRYKNRITKLNRDFNFIKKVNHGAEFMEEQHKNRVKKIASKYIIVKDSKISLLSENEMKNLLISRGTLTGEEREIINSHVTATIDMLEQLPYPKSLKNVPEIAGGHHEKLDGSGYPKGLKGEKMSTQAKMIAIADIFEALTAKDRPYKKGKTLSEALGILKEMRDQNHIDPDLFEIFIKEKIYLKYAEKFQSKNQIDDIKEIY